ncbi:protein of unknown function [Nitrospira defluvii]|jgi:hypothetical protein|uniref:Uncharacterized protein n=1 Tax=Nitrospira defluvii TaxID=330214 RepID=D8P837_9BACT|nr:protein of unknown function [Nitrospira defluvii]
MRDAGARKLVSVPSGDALIPHRWIALPGQPSYVAAMTTLRTVETQIAEAQRACLVNESDRLQADRLEAETNLLHITDRLHMDLQDLLSPAVTGFVRYTLNSLVAFLQWQLILSNSSLMVQNTGFSSSALPLRSTIDAVLALDLRSAFSLLIASAQVSQAITSAEASELLSGKLLSMSNPTAK